MNKAGQSTATLAPSTAGTICFNTKTRHARFNGHRRAVKKRPATSCKKSSFDFSLKQNVIHLNKFISLLSVKEIYNQNSGVNCNIFYFCKTFIVGSYKGPFTNLLIQTISQPVNTKILSSVTMAKQVNKMGFIIYLYQTYTGSEWQYMLFLFTDKTLLSIISKNVLNYGRKTSFAVVDAHLFS